jgi:GTPase
LREKELSLIPQIDININKEELIEKNYKKERYYGNTEYKLMLMNITPDRLDHLVTQMKFRLREGHGECYYIIGVEDNGNALGIGEEELKTSLETLSIMSQRIDAEMSILQYTKGKQGIIAEIMIKEKKIIEEKAEIKIGMIGEENSGKSTLVRYFFI